MSTNDLVGGLILLYVAGMLLLLVGGIVASLIHGAWLRRHNKEEIHDE